MNGVSSRALEWLTLEKGMADDFSEVPSTSGMPFQYRSVYQLMAEKKWYEGGCSLVGRSWREVRQAGADPIYFRKVLVRTAGVVGM